MRPRVFLSHSSQDSLAVGQIKAHAEAAGVDVYVAEHDVQPGRSLAAKILSELRSSDAVVVLLTDTGASSSFVNQEIGAALDRGLLVVPLVQKGLAADLAMLLGAERIEFDHDHPEPALLALTRSLTDFVEKGRAEERNEAVARARADALLLAAGVVILIFILAASSE
jgi:hypothetical protein